MSAAQEFKKAGTIFKPTGNVDKREVFAAEAEPLIKAAVEKLKELGMPFVFGVGTGYELGEEGQIHTLTAYGHGNDQYMPPSLAMAAIALDLDHGGCVSCFMKEALQCKLVSPDSKIALPKGHPFTEQIKGKIAEAAGHPAPSGGAATKEQMDEVKAEFFGKN